jgi:hypothetical protein
MPNSIHGIWPLTTSVVTRMVALTKQLTAPPGTSEAMI